MALDTFNPYTDYRRRTLDEDNPYAAYPTLAEMGGDMQRPLDTANPYAEPPPVRSLDEVNPYAPNELDRPLDETNPYARALTRNNQYGAV